MDSIQLIIPSTVYHISQIITGFLMLREQGWQVEITDQSGSRENPFYNLPVCLARYRGMTLAYDLWDGYQNPDDMARVLAASDLYFKRSFDAARNARLFPNAAGKMRPLGLNYHVTCPGNPINEPVWKDLAKRVAGRAPERYFVPEVFEGKAERRQEPPKILFLTQLWDTDAPGLSAEDRQERQRINTDRIRILRALREKFGDRFIGGLNDTNSALPRSLAPELIVDRRQTERRQYLQTVHGCDICIGTMGLYESIGWKTAEYVAAAKAIVNERLHYMPAGDFAEGKNYLPFTTPEECVAAVEALAADPEARYRMACANERYYRQYLRPDALVANTLRAADETVH